MYHRIIMQCALAVETIEKWLDKAERHASAENVDIAELLNGRLTDDMKPLIYQVQSACDYLKGGAALLSGQKPPSHADDERSIDEVRARIRKTVEFARSVTADAYAGAAEQRLKLSFVPGKVIHGEDYVVQITIPNIYFHICMVYAILRQAGVDVGKMDFLGDMNFVEG
jgi:hypothetical protein